MAHRFSATAACALAALSAALLVLSFPPFSGGAIVGWCALVPLLFALRGASARRAAAVGILFGALSNLGIFFWLLQVPGIRVYQFAALNAVFCVYPALWCVLASRIDPAKPVYELAVAASWVSVEYLPSHAGFLALPWATLAQTQVADTWLLQSAALFGEPFVGFLVALGNVVIYRLLESRMSRSRGRAPLARLAWTLPILAAFAFGAWIVRTDHAAPSDGIGSGAQRLDVAALQTHYAAYGPRRVSSGRRMSELLTFLQRDWPSNAGLAVLPESSFANLDADPDAASALQVLSHSNGTAVIAGVAQAAKFEQAPAQARAGLTQPAPTHQLAPAEQLVTAGQLVTGDQLVAASRPISRDRTGAPDRRVVNAAWIFTPDGAEPSRYRKVRRLAFAEYQPLAEWVRLPRWLVGQPIEVVPGSGPRTFAVGADRNVGVLICWESLFAEHSRVLTAQGVAALVLLTNEAWFEGTAASAQHDLAARMRAVETHRPVVIASNAGRSMIIDRLGRISAASADRAGPRWVTGVVRTDTALTPYVRYGDAFAFACLALTFLVMLRTLLRARRLLRHAGPLPQ